MRLHPVFTLRRLLALVVLGGWILLAVGCDDPARSEPVVAVEVSAPSAFLDSGQVVQLTATALGASGDAVAGKRFAWESSNETVAVVDDGRVTAVAPGTVNIFARVGEVEGSLGLTVEVPVARLSVAPTSLTMSPSKTVRLTVTMLDHNGRPMTHSVRFASSAPSVATVGDSGAVRAVAAGSAVVTVIVGAQIVEVPVAVEPPYTLAYLGTLGGQESVANDINVSGQVVGRAQADDGSWRAFLWEGGQMRDLGSLGYPFNEAVAINDRGVVVGTAAQNQCVDCYPGWSGPKQPWRWAAGEVESVSIPTADGSGEVAVLTDVNDAGQITGYTFAGGYRWAVGEAFVWKDGALTWLGKHGKTQQSVSPDTALRGIAAAINDAGLVAGSMVFYAFEEHPIAWQDGRFYDAGPVEYGYTRAVDVNGEGVVVGVSSRHGLYTWKDGATTFLAQIGPRGMPQAINEERQIVGTAAPYKEEEYAFLWRNGRLINLNHLVVEEEWTIVGANGINDRGQIVGYGTHGETGAKGAVLLTPPQ